MCIRDRKRSSRRLGMTKEEDPVKIEYDLMKKLPKDHWTLWNIHIITFGRTICTARNPKDVYKRQPPIGAYVTLIRC